MEEWYTKVRLLKDESETPYETEKVCHKMFYDLKRSKIREKGKFKNRMGPEFDGWTALLVQDYPEPFVKEIINDDEFWNLTLSLLLRV